MPSYGLMIVVALAVVNVFALVVSSHRGLIFYDFLIIECYAGLGAILGSKLLFLLTVIGDIDWDLFFSDSNYFNTFMRGGFVFWGGLICAVPFVLIGSKKHRIKLKDYLNVLAFVVPLGHGFGRIGCFLAGCCYGVENHSFFSVVYPSGGFAPAGVSLLPIQLIEAFVLFLTSALVYVLYLRPGKERGFVFYIVSYSISRFILESFRGDVYRGFFKGFSTSQWICILVLLSTLFVLLFEKLYHSCKN